jgi:hypothetical protein
VSKKKIAVKKYVVELSAEERERLEALIHTGKSSARVLTRARMLLKADVSEAGEGWSTAQSRQRWTPASTMSLARVSSWSRRGSRRR